MKTRIFNLIIIDESGSMHGIKEATIDSVNETIQTIRAAQQKHEEQEHFVTLVTFNNEVTTVYECVPVGEVQELTAETYNPNCCTALYDAMGMSLTALRRKVAQDDSVLVTVVTDGLENASREYSGAAVKALVEELKALNWVFAYIGANHDVVGAARNISITNVMNFTATPVGTHCMTSYVNESRMRLYDTIDAVGCCPPSAQDDFFSK